MGSGWLMGRTRAEYPDILDVLRAMGVSERELRRLRRKRLGRRRDRPRCGARRRDGDQCQAHAVRDRNTGRVLHNGRCRLHGGLSTGPRTAAGKAAIAEANRRRALARRARMAPSTRAE
jgi:hypothetical protein